MTAAQQRFLLNRLQEANGAKPGRWTPVPMKEPVWLKRVTAERDRAQKLLDGWDKRLQRAREKRNKKASDTYLAVKTAILFGDLKKALKAIEKFERTTF